MIAPRFDHWNDTEVLHGYIRWKSLELDMRINSRPLEQELLRRSIPLPTEFESTLPVSKAIRDAERERHD